MSIFSSRFFGGVIGFVSFFWILVYCGGIVCAIYMVIFLLFLVLKIVVKYI